MSKNRLALTVFLFSLLGATAPGAEEPPLRSREEPPCYTLESLEGSWTIISTFGANVASALGKREIESDGSFTGTFLLNGPIADGRTNDHHRYAERNLRRQLRRHRHHHPHRGGRERHHGESDR